MGLWEEALGMASSLICVTNRSAAEIMAAAFHREACLSSGSPPMAGLSRSSISRFARSSRVRQTCSSVMADTVSLRRTASSTLNLGSFMTETVLSTMTISELIQKLEAADPDSEITVYCDDTHVRSGIIGFFATSSENDGDGPEDVEYPVLIIGDS